MNKIIKRDGRTVDFDRNRIINAVKRAFEATDGEVFDDYASAKANHIADYVEKYINEQDHNISVEDVQDIVEKGLMSCKKKDVAKEYIIYREKRTRQRDRNSKFRHVIKEKLMASNVQNQNANVDEHSFGGRTGEAASELNRQVALDEVLSPMARRNHLNNEIYQHDLDHFILGDSNCLSVPFDDLLKNGFNTRQTDVRPANSINTAFQLVAVIFQIQSLNQFGGVSATHIDWTMIPYVRKSFMKHYITEMLKDTDDFVKLNLMEMLFETYKEPVYGRYTVTRNKFDDWVDEHKEQILKENNLTQDDFYFDNENLNAKYKQSAMFDTIKETYQAVEGLFHNLNTLQSRSGNQLPFTSINYGTCTVTEGRLITKAILDTSIKGIGKLHKTAIFPCQIFQCMKGVNRQKGDPNYDLFQLAIKSTTKRLYPNYCNVDWSVNKGYDRNNPEEYVATMGCRTYNGYDMNGFGQMKDGRGNICPVTIILPTLAMESKGEVGHKDVEDFMKILDTKIHEAKITLEERFNYICSQDPASAKFMYENGTMRGYVPEEGIISAMKHGTLAIGQLGLAECLQILIDTNQCTEKGMELAKKIEQLFKDRCNEFKHELHHLDNGYEYYLNYGVYYTPAENLCYKAMKAFRKKYGVIPKISDKEFFTNSEHVPVWEVMNPFQKIDIESQLTGYSSAGCITYVELDANAKINLKAVETIIDYAMDKDIPYFAINVPADTCMDCGYEDEIADTCPNCGGHNIQHLRRVTGYLTGDYMSSFNKGKQDEVRHRYKHSHSLSMNTWKEEQ